MSLNQNILHIKASHLVTAMLNNQFEIVYYLDLKTGDIVTLTEDDGTGVTEDGLTFGIQYTPELRLLFIEPLLAHEREWMIEHFVEALPNSILKYRLTKELGIGGSINLSQYPDLKQQWNTFLEEEITELFSQWLLQIGVDAQILLSSEMDMHLC